MSDSEREPDKDLSPPTAPDDSEHEETVEQDICGQPKASPESEVDHDPDFDRDDQVPDDSVDEAVYEDVEDNPSDELSEIKKNLQGDDAEDEEQDGIEAIESGQEYIKITPAREQISSETVKRELYGLHEYGDGKKLPLDLELHIKSIEGVSNFEFIIYKPPGEPQFQFLLGPGERGDVTCDRLESTTRSQYPETYDFDRETFELRMYSTTYLTWSGTRVSRRNARIG